MAGFSGLAGLGLDAFGLLFSGSLWGDTWFGIKLCSLILPHPEQLSHLVHSHTIHVGLSLIDLIY